MYPGMQFPSIAGSDGAGVIDAVGEGGDDTLIGDEVLNVLYHQNPSLFLPSFCLAN